VCVSVCVCLSVCPRGYLRNRTRCLYQIFVHVAYGLRSSSGVVEIRYNRLLPALWMTTCIFPIMGRMNFATKDRFRLNLLLYRKVGHNSIFYY